MHKAVFQVEIFLRQNNERQGKAVLAIELPFAPTTKIEYSHPVWSNSRKPFSVCYDVVDESFCLDLGFDKLNSTEEVEARLEKYRSNGWVIRP